jgi:tripartite-type tricarboxylate transporter receptor subunit TctC
VVENRPGASGLIGSDAVAKSPADGYTLMVGSQTTLAVAPALYKKFTGDASKDFTGISMIGISPLVAIVNPASPIKSISELIASAKSKSEPMMFGSGGVGTTPHMAGELFAFTSGIKMSHVAYRGEAPAVNDLLGQQIPFMFSNASVVLSNVKAGKLRGLAVTTAKRTSFAPEIPTIAETLPGFEAATWFALVAPAGTPRDIVQKLNAEIQKFAALPETQQRFADLGMTSESSTPEALDATIKSEIAKWAKVIKDADIKPAD